MTTEVYEIHGIRFAINAHDLGADADTCTEHAYAALAKLDCDTARKLADTLRDEGGFEAIHEPGHELEAVISDIEQAGYAAAGDWTATAYKSGACPMVTVDIYRG